MSHPAGDIPQYGLKFLRFFGLPSSVRCVAEVSGGGAAGTCGAIDMIPGAVELAANPPSFRPLDLLGLPYPMESIGRMPMSNPHSNGYYVVQLFNSEGMHTCHD